MGMVSGGATRRAASQYDGNDEVAARVKWNANWIRVQPSSSLLRQSLCYHHLVCIIAVPHVSDGKIRAAPDYSRN